MNIGGGCNMVQIRKKKKRGVRMNTLSGGMSKSTAAPIKLATQKPFKKEVCIVT